MKAFSVVLMMAVGVLPLSGCLRKEVRQTIYLSPSGVAWSVLEADVRSDEETSAKRTAEEHDYFLAASAGSHPVAQAFRRLGALSVQTTWLRRERPYSVVTEAHFTDVRQLALAIIHSAHATGDASLVRTGCRTSFTAQVDLESASDEAGEDDSALNELLTDLDTYRFVLTEGRFVSADGFLIEDDGAVAIPDAKKTADNGVLALALAWTDGGCGDR